MLLRDGTSAVISGLTLRGESMASILNRIRRKIIRLTASPVKYAKIVGVSFGNDLHIYGTIHWVVSHGL